MANAPIVIPFSGAVTIRQADDIAGRLKLALATADRIEIDCGGVTEADTAFIQLIIATRKSALKAGKALVLSAPAKGDLLKTLAAIGIQPDGSQDFWFQGREG